MKLFKNCICWGLCIVFGIFTGDASFIAASFVICAMGFGDD